MKAAITGNVYHRPPRGINRKDNEKLESQGIDPSQMYSLDLFPKDKDGVLFQIAKALSIKYGEPFGLMFAFKHQCDEDVFAFFGLPTRLIGNDGKAIQGAKAKHYVIARIPSMKQEAA